MLQPDGKILVGGDFTAYNGTGMARIVRLLANATVDPIFNNGGAGATVPGSTARNPVQALVLQPTAAGLAAHLPRRMTNLARLRSIGRCGTGFTS